MKAKLRAVGLRYVFGVAALLICTSCVSQGPSRLTSDRFDYNEAVAGSWRTQTLLAIVKLRYSDWPVFMDVEQIVAQYTWENTGSLKATIRTPLGGDSDQSEAGWVGKFSERPAILYKPLRGAKYMKNILTPVPSGALLGLVYTGWPVDQIMEIMVQSVNGHRNSQVEDGMQVQSDSRFAEFLQTLRMFQLKDALVVEVEALADKKTESAKVETRLTFLTERVGDETRQRLTDMKVELGLAADTNCYRVIWGTVPPNDRTIALETRSVLQLMVVLAAHVDVPQREVDEGRVVRLQPWPRDESSGLAPLMQVRRGASAPPDAYASCQYRGQDFWIADTDVHSKQTFTYLTLLLTLGDVDDRSGTPLVISTN